MIILDLALGNRAPDYAVERSCAEPPQWSVYVVDIFGGVGPRAFGPFDHRHIAEAWARAHGVLAEPCVEAA